MLRAHPEVKAYSSMAARFWVAGGGQEVRKATFSINLMNKDDRNHAERRCEIADGGAGETARHPLLGHQ